jgi:hypothetical protein
MFAAIYLCILKTHICLVKKGWICVVKTLLHAECKMCATIATICSLPNANKKRKRMSDVL